MKEFLQRLRQRKLVQWGLAYVAAAFALLQGIDIVAQQFAWPESVRRGFTLALVVGFFVTLVLAWYHGERGAQKISGSELLFLAVILGIGGALLWRFAGIPSKHRAISVTASGGVTATPATIPAVSSPTINAGWPHQAHRPNTARATRRKRDMQGSSIQQVATIAS